MKTLLTILFWITVAVTPTEKYYVTFVKGQVLLSNTKKPVKIGDALNPDDKLIFKDKTAKISCISPGKGRFDITPQAAKAGTGGELLAVLKASLVPASGTYHLSTRALTFEGNDPATYFASQATNNRILLIEGEPLPIKSSYKMDAGNFFFIQFNEGDKPVTRKVEYTDKGLVFSSKLLSTKAGTLADNVILCYQTNTGGAAKSSALVTFSPVVATKADIAQQIKLITDSTTGSDKKKQKAEIANHLFENYGKIGTDDLQRIFGI